MLCLHKQVLHHQKAGQTSKWQAQVVWSSVQLIKPSWPWADSRQAFIAPSQPRLGIVGSSFHVCWRLRMEPLTVHLFKIVTCSDDVTKASSCCQSAALDCRLNGRPSHLQCQIQLLISSAALGLFCRAYDQPNRALDVALEAPGTLPHSAGDIHGDIHRR